MTSAYKQTKKPSKRLDPINFNDLITPEIAKPARYMGHELGVMPRDWNQANVHWALTYPELYEVGASNLGHIILYSILNQIPRQLCDRSYLPAPDLGKRLRETNQLLFGVESRRPLFCFDILGFSLSYELGATNILEMLDLAGIPIYASERKDLPLDDDNCPPLVFAGGPSATSNPEPYANFFDFFALGDGEELLPEIGLITEEGKKAKLSRSSLLIELSGIPGVYVPSLYTQSEDNISLKPINSSIPRQIIRRVANPIPFYGTGLVPNIETIHDRLTIEIRRGCTRGCRFCQPGMLTRPARDVKPKEIINAVEKGMRKTGYSDFSLLSLSCSDYLALPSVGVEIKNKLSEENISLQLPSQRVDRFDDNIAHILGGTRKPGITFAPEAGSQRLRDIINKGLTDEDLLRGIQNAMKNGYKKIKLYFMIGLPGETEEDVLDIAKTCRELQDKCKNLGRLKLNITISNFTPKPHTPFQWHSVSSKEFERRQNILKQAFYGLQGTKINFTDIRLSMMEDFLGRGDRRLAYVIEQAWKNGAGMDAWFESIDRAYNAWKKAINEAGLEGSYRTLEIGNWGNVKKLSNEEIDDFCSKKLPWDHINTGISKTWLAKDLKRALNHTVVEDCSFNGCSQCGVCGDDLGHNKIVKPYETPKRITGKSPPSEKICRIRLKFQKKVPFHLIGHLDLMRLFERALRRSQLPFSFTGGFHPLPRLQIALALPLGVQGNGEWMDIDFYKSIDPIIAQERLNNELPQGIKIVESLSIPKNRPSLSQEIVGASWSFDLKNIEYINENRILVEKGLTSIMNSKELIWRDTDKKGRERERNLREFLKSINMSKNKNDCLNLADNQLIRIQVNCLVDDMGRSIKPIQVKSWLERYLGQVLELENVVRDEIHLLKC